MGPTSKGRGGEEGKGRGREGKGKGENGSLPTFLFKFTPLNILYDYYMIW